MWLIAAAILASYVAGLATAGGLAVLIYRMVVVGRLWG